MTPRDAICPSWTDLLTEGPLAIGYDIATTEKAKSNPSGLTVMQRDARLCISRLVLSWKTADPAVAHQVIACVLDDLESARHKPRRLVIDASSEKYFAVATRTAFRNRCPVELISGSQKLKFRNEELDSKSLLGNMYVSAMEDGLILLPAGDWIELDLRLVKREAGRFVTELGPSGEHGDLFDAGKLAYWGLQSGGNSAEGVRAIAVGGTASPGRHGRQGSFQKNRHQLPG
jgi:hypothetical protein